MRQLCVFVLFTLGLLATNETSGQIPAFSGAEGAGAFATGGRPNSLGGVVYHVTTLDPDPEGIIPGSLRYGMKNENFDVVRPDWPLPFPNHQVADSFDVIPRLIVFDVGGTINMGEVDMTPINFTIAGQTAPGGITLYGGEFNPGHRDSWDEGTPPKVNNLIIRNMSIRTHDAAEKDGLWLPASNSIADHMSLSWYTDEGVSITDSARDVTVQYNIVGPGWNNPDGDGSQIEGKTPGADISVHHNLYVHNDARVPRVGEKEGPGVELDFRNNVVYNWNDSKAGYSTGSEPSFNNFVNNYYIGSTDTDNNDVIFNTGNSVTRIYQSGNLLDRDFDGIADGQDLGWAVFTGNELQQTVPYAVPHGVTQTATEALESVTSYAGANWWDRHELDERVINQVGTYGLGTVEEKGRVLSTIDPNDVDAIVNAPMQSRPAGWDTDNDGMPNHWEIERGLDPDVADWSLDDDTDGYVNLEEYINEIAEWPAPFEILWTGGNERYAEINNWSITRSSPGEAATTTHWQPSRFDAAVVNSGTITVDANGQHAGAILLGTAPGSNPTFNVTSGWLEVEEEAFGTGNGEFAIGVSDNATATLNLSGGKLRTELLTKGDAGVFNFTGGTLAADTVAFSIVNQGGEIAPGDSPGVTHVLGDLTMVGGSIALEIAGTSAGQFDRLLVDGTFAAGGTLNVLLAGYAPAEGDSFDLLDFGAATGGMSVSLPDLQEGLAWDSSAFLTTGVLSVVAGMVENADFDGDGDVDGRDFLIWQRGFGLTDQGDNANGDANGDGEVNASDLEIWQTQYVDTGELTAVTAVPEPATALLLGSLSLMLIARRRMA